MSYFGANGRTDAKPESKAEFDLQIDRLKDWAFKGFKLKIPQHGRPYIADYKEVKALDLPDFGLPGVVDRLLNFHSAFADLNRISKNYPLTYRYCKLCVRGEGRFREPEEFYDEDGFAYKDDYLVDFENLNHVRALISSI